MVSTVLSNPCRRRGIIAARKYEELSNGEERRREAESHDQERSGEVRQQEAGERHARSEGQGRQELLNCAKCGRAIGRGRHLHEKHCKG